MHDVLKSPSLLQCAPRKRRVLFAVFQTGRLANGGVESITEVITALREMDRIVVTNLETPFCDRWRASGAEVVVWDLPYAMGSARHAHGWRGLARRAWSLVWTNLQVASWIRRGKINLIHCNDPAPFWHLAPAAKITRTPIVFNLRDTKAPNEALNARRYRRRFRLSSRVLVLSQEMRDFYQRAVRPSPKVVIEAIHSAVDLQQMKPLPNAEREALRERLGIAPGTLALGFFAAFCDKKNQLGYLREAVPALARLCPAAHTFFIGDFEPAADPYARLCAEIAAQEGRASAVTMRGYTSAVADWYRACDLIVVPTRKEGLVRCMIEALACGTPVVSFDVCSAREILEVGECGAVIPQGNYEMLADAVRALVDNPAKLARLRANAVQTAQRLFNPKRMVAEYRALYCSIS